MSLISTKGFLRGAALAVAGAAALGAGSAHAFTCSVGALKSCNQSVGNFSISSVTVLNGSFDPTTEFLFDLKSSDPSGKTLYFELTRIATGTALPLSGKIEFTVSASPTNSYYLSRYNNVGVTTVNVNPFVSAFTFGGTGVGSTTDTALFTQEGSISSSPISGTYSFEWNVVAAPSRTARVDSLSGEFISSEVPGPLPAMAAAVAFGFSRKLRSRLKPVV